MVGEECRRLLRTHDRPGRHFTGAVRHYAVPAGRCGTGVREEDPANAKERD